MPVQLVGNVVSEPHTLRQTVPLPPDDTVLPDASLWQPTCLEMTHRVDVGVREAMVELRDSDPRAAARVDAALAEMPEVGGEFLGFHLVHELGRGAFGRVFLARQTALAGRLVALKVAPDLNGESQRLAQLQHTNIMPIFSEHRSGNLHAVCMPYFGSTTLADLYKALRTHHSLPTSGKHLVSTLFNRQSTVRGNGDPSLASSRGHWETGSDSGLTVLPPVPLLATAPANLSKIEQMSYVDAVLWIAARLADGLAHAHERGIIHRDLKPANVLLCDDGQPMLLDFNLAEDVKLRSAVAVAHVGGTLPYMSPEQLCAYRDGSGQVDGRSDIYALGLILFHLLAGQHAFPIRKGKSKFILPRMIDDRKVPAPSIRALNRSVSPAVESIVLHCLRHNPQQRYQTARDLAEDIERHRANLPLRHAPEPSVAERAAKWARRHPKLASPATLSALIAAVMLAVVTGGVYLSLEARKERLAQELSQRHEDALRKLAAFDGRSQLAFDLLTTDDPVLLVEGMKHGEKALGEYQALERGDWLTQPAVAELTPAERDRLQARVGEIAFLLARAAYFQPQKGGADNLDRALAMNRIAQANLGGDAKPILAQQHADLAAKETDTLEYQRMRNQLQGAAVLNPAARFLLAAEDAARGRYREALTQLDQVVGADPQNFGAWFLKARCHHLLDEDVPAIAAYGTTIVLRPNYARSYVARAEVFYAKMKNLDQAKLDLDHAITLQPGLVEARIDRALVLYAMNKAKEALPDLDWAVEQEAVPARIWFVRARVRATVGDLAGAAKDRAEGLKNEPGDPISWVCRGMAKLDDDPEGALADFATAEQLYPRCREALFNQAYVYGARLKKPEEAVAALDRLLLHHPDDCKAMSYRAILLGRLGRVDDAVAQARACLKVNSGAENQYRAACAFALCSTKQPALRAESLKLLAGALMRGFGHGQLPGDHDLDPIREMPEFKQFEAFASVMNTLTRPGAIE